MIDKLSGLKIALAGSLFMGSAVAVAAPPAESMGPMMGAGHSMAPMTGSPELVQKKQAVQGVSADAQTVLSALQRDPTLAGQLAKNPEGAEALLRSKGATRSEHIIVKPTGDGAAREIVITIVIDHVTIEIIIKL